MKRRDLLRLPLNAAMEGVAPVLERSVRPAPGSEAGDLQSMPGATRPRVTVMTYGGHEFQEFEVDDELKYLGRLCDRYPVVWVNVLGADHAQTVQGIGEAFGLHRLALEDVMHTCQRAKVEPYDDHLFMVLKMARRTTELDLEQVSLFLGPRFVVTFQQHADDVFGQISERIRGNHQRTRTSGPDYLAYALIDAVIDNYFPVLEQYGDEMEGLEDDIVERPTHACVHRLHELKRELMGLRRAVWPLREALGVLLRDGCDLVKPDTVVYLRDCQDHAFQVLDLVENFREVAASLTDLYISTVGNRTNDIMKVLTIFAALFIPLSFITGVYGMNLAHPDHAWFWGWPFASAVMLAIVAALMLFFYRRGWILDRG